MQAKTRMEYGGLVLAALVVGGAYLLCLAAFFLWQGTLPPFTLAGSLGYLAIQIALALALRAGARVEGWIIALLALYVLVLGRLFSQLDSLRLNALVSSAQDGERSVGSLVALYSYAIGWMGATSPGVLLNAGLLLSACVARLASRRAARRSEV